MKRIFGKKPYDLWEKDIFYNLYTILKKENHTGLDINEKLSFLNDLIIWSNNKESTDIIEKINTKISSNKKNENPNILNKNIEPSSQTIANEYWMFKWNNSSEALDIDTFIDQIPLFKYTIDSNLRFKQKKIFEKFKRYAIYTENTCEKSIEKFVTKIIKILNNSDSEIISDEYRIKFCLALQVLYYNAGIKYNDQIIDILKNYDNFHGDIDFYTTGLSNEIAEEIPIYYIEMYIKYDKDHASKWLSILLNLFNNNLKEKYADAITYILYRKINLRYLNNNYLMLDGLDMISMKVNVHEQEYNIFNYIINFNSKKYLPVSLLYMYFFLRDIDRTKALSVLNQSKKMLEKIKSNDLLNIYLLIQYMHLLEFGEDSPYETVYYMLERRLQNNIITNIKDMFKITIPFNACLQNILGLYLHNCKNKREFIEEFYRDLYRMIDRDDEPKKRDIIQS